MIKGTHVSHTHQESAAAILLPIKIAEKVTGPPGYGKDWYGIKTDKHIYISVHAHKIEKNDETSDYPEACANIHEWIGNDNDTHTTIIGIDANTTLPRNITNITGNFTLNPLQSHNRLTQNRILNLIEPLRLKAPKLMHRTVTTISLQEVKTAATHRLTTY